MNNDDKQHAKKNQQQEVKDSHGSENKTPQQNPKFNWRLLAIFSTIALILIFAWQTTVNGLGARKISLDKFVHLYKAGRVVGSELFNQELNLTGKQLQEFAKKNHLNANSKPQMYVEQGESKFRITGKVLTSRVYQEKTATSKEIGYYVELNSFLFQKEISYLNKEIGFNFMPLGNKLDYKKGREPLEYRKFEYYLYNQFINKDSVIMMSPDNQKVVIVGSFFRPERVANPKNKVTSFVVNYDFNQLQGSPEKVKWLYKVTELQKTRSFWNSIKGWLPLIIMLAVLFLIFRVQIKSMGRGAMQFGKSKAKLIDENKNSITFDDVAGVEESKEELEEVVDFLKNPNKFFEIGARIPRGILMVGPPGTGKTLLAKAVAGEAGVPFFAISGADFVEMFVGVGASRVRDMFEQAKKHMPCIIFIDEIDSVGRRRGQGQGGGNDEREQTLNAMLVEMDGFDEQTGIIVIAATNRADVLDPALLRPGRFDRQVEVAVPDMRGRYEILQVHTKKIKMAAEVCLQTVARGTPGFSGAELANLVNEAALAVAREGRKLVAQNDLEVARDKVCWGKERRSLALSEKEKENTAYHEAGHAICNLICEGTDPLHRLTIVPRGRALGMAMFLPEDDKVSYRKETMHADLCVAMGGRVAEEIIFGNVTSGAMGDINQASNLARKMVCEWGLSDKLGMVAYGANPNSNYFVEAKNYSEETAYIIDQEVKLFIDQAYQRAKTILTEHKEALVKIAKALLEYETLEGSQVKELLENGVMKNPPKNIMPPEVKTDEKIETADASKVDNNKVEVDDTADNKDEQDDVSNKVDDMAAEQDVKADNKKDKVK